MNPDMEQKVLSTLYDRLYDIITYNPGGGKTPQFDKATTFLQMAKNNAINPKDFANAVNPANPGGSLATAEAFSRMADSIPAVQVEYVTSGSAVDNVFGNIVNGANSNDKPDPEQLELYRQAYNYLNTTREQTDFKGNKKIVTEPSDIFLNYQTQQLGYYSAISAYRSAYNSYDLTDPKQQREFQANAPLLQAAVDQAWQKYRAADASLVEEALATLDTSVNSAVRNVLENARKTYKDGSLASNDTGLPNWHLSYAMPTDWTDPDAAGFSKFTLKSSYLNKSASSSATAYGGGASWNAGLWSVGGGVEGSEGRTQSHMDASEFELSAEIATVRIQRSWLDGTIFLMKKWFMSGFDVGSISSGKLQGLNGMMPLLPQTFVVARNIKISSSFTTEDKSHIEKAISGTTTVGWGPFKISGHYSHKSSQDTFNSTFDGGTLTVPGMQIIGWVSAIVPFSPPQGAP